MIHHGDCLDVMADMEPESVDAIVTDPPYGLEFMGKEWDRLWDQRDDGHKGRGGMGTWATRPTYQAGTQAQQFHVRWAEAAYRVAKPSAYLLAFGGTRTVHRMTVALEDAGWIIRDMLVWAYASGFPKSKASLKPAWEPIVMARKPGPLRELAIDACRLSAEGNVTFTERIRQDEERRKEYRKGTVRGQVPTTAGRWPANVILTDPIFDGGIEGVVGGGEAGGGFGIRGRNALGVINDDGWEPSDEGSIVGYGDSGTYSRFFLIPKADRSDREPVLGGLPERSAGVTGRRSVEAGEYDEFVYPPPPGIGAWLRDQREAAGLRQKDVAAHFLSKTGGLTGAVANWELEFNRPTPDQWRTLRAVIGFDDRHDEVMTTTTSVPRELFDDREPPKRRNVHPTVKPTDLMRHLVRLVTPPGGLVLDPFLGSGTTGLAAEMEGFPWIGIEREAEYVAIAEARLNGTQRGLGLVEPHKETA